METKIKIKKKKAFTLTEVLLALTIIGIVAAFTIPSLMQNTQNSSLKTAWKQNYSNFNSAIQLLLKDNSSNLEGIFGNKDDFRDEFLQHMNYVRKCNANAGQDGVCWHAVNGWSYLNGTVITADYTSYSRAVLNNGALVLFYHYAVNCDVGDGPLNNICGRIYVDVNGFKGPNVYGKDIFTFFVLSNGIKPTGYPGTSSVIFSTCIEGDTSENNKGGSCSLKYLLQ